MMTRFFVLSGLVVLSMLPNLCQADEEAAVYSRRERLSFEQMIEELRQADVVFLGENHDHKRGHRLQFAIFKALFARSPALALSLEMFERDTQGVLDEYLGGYISEPSFLQAARPWPNYKEDYRPLVEFCKENRLPVVAANAPRRYVSIVSRKGPDALRELPRASKTYLAPLPYALDLPAGYDRQLTEIFSAQHNSTPTGSANTSPPPGTGAAPAMPTVANMKAAQALWDATMADSILRFRRANRGRRVVQLNGAMHSDSGYGIVDRLRKAAPRTKIRIVTIRPEPGYPNLPSALAEDIADFVILTPKD